MTRLKNTDVNDMLTSVNAYKKTVQDAFYNHYKNVYKLSKTNNFRGKSAESYKLYLESVTINYINAMLNISDEASKTLENMKKCYDEFESSESGVIDTETLEDVKKELGTKKDSFDSLVTEIKAVNTKASKYVSIKALNDADIDGQYTDIGKDTDNIKNELIEVDTNALKMAEDLLDRINKIKYSIDTIKNDYHTDGKINADKVSEIKVQGWYQDEITDNLKAKMEGDPFKYGADAWYFGEDQWAYGYASDFYGAAGYNKLGGSYNYERNNGVMSGNIQGTLANAYVNGQFTDYLKGKANIGLGNTAANGKVGWSDKYKGFSVDGSASVAEANGSLVLGSDKFNGYVKGNASALSASGNVTCQFEDKGQFDVGLKGKATLGEASVTLGTSIFSIPAKEEDIKKGSLAGGKIETKKEKSLLGASISFKATAGGSVGGGVSSTRAYEWGPFAVNAITIKGDIALGLGLEGDVTVPVPGINW